MIDWAHTADYRLFLQKRGQVDLWQLPTMVSCQALLVTAGSTNQAEFVLADTDGSLSQGSAVPHAMDYVQLWLVNRYGQWGIAWTGYVDEVHRLKAADQGILVQLICSGPYKLWETTNLSPSEDVMLALAEADNLSGSSILALSAQKVGFPAGLLVIADDADSGTGLQSGGILAAATTPEEQTWSAVMQSLLANTGNEFFFDEACRGHWRRVAFLTPSGFQPRQVVPEDIFHLDLAESDQGVATRVEVRWGTQPMLSTARFWQAPAVMEQQLGRRRQVFYAPWILDPSGVAAQNLANVLGLQFSAQVLQGSVTLPADPLYGVGTVVRVPTLERGQAGAMTDYYIASVAYNLVWGQTWTTTLGLRYGRSVDQNFPYIGTENAYPVRSTHSGTQLLSVASLTALSFSPTHPQRATEAFTVRADPALTATQVKADSSILPVGTIIQVDTPGGTPLGKSPNGEYTVVAGGSGYTLGLLQTTAAQAQITIVSAGQADSPTTSSPPGGMFPVSGPTLTTPGTGYGTTTDAPPLATPNSLARRAMARAYSLRRYPYVSAAGGPTAFDCSGLVFFAWATVDGGAYQRAHPDFVHTGPNGEYSWFLQHGAVAIAVEDAQPGDLLFIVQPSTANTYFTQQQQGFSHVAWLYTKGVTYGANNQTDGLRTFNIAGYTDSYGYGFTNALSMSGVF